MSNIQTHYTQTINVLNIILLLLHKWVSPYNVILSKFDKKYVLSKSMPCKNWDIEYIGYR